jgi:hypothetical protein
VARLFEAIARLVSEAARAKLDAMELLPPAEERVSLLERLAAYLGEHGTTSWLVAPILEPTNRWFPDRWEPTSQGVERLAMRLLRYAGHSLETIADPRAAPDETESCSLAHRMPVWLDHVSDTTCILGFDEADLLDAEAAVAATCHAVAHLVQTRRTHEARRECGYRSAPRRAELPVEALEELTDLVTIELGFGVLTTNATERHRSRQASETRVSSSVRVHRMGTLSPQAMSFLLAAEVVSRGLRRTARRRIVGQLEPNQAACFAKACDYLERLVPSLSAKLRLPPTEEWPAPADLEALTSPLPYEPEYDEL